MAYAGHGLLQHSSLAATTEGQVLGVLHQIGWKRVETPPGETRRQRQFWWTIAKRGGFIGRKSDGQPGWQTIGKGWMEVTKLIEGLEIHQAILREQSCG